MNKPKPKPTAKPVKKPVKPKAPAVPPMHPRERLTTKAKRAIQAYVIARLGEMPLLYLAIDYTIEAERMPRERLYAWLEERGYRWRDKLWEKSRSAAAEPSLP